jgi:hypothetical protein
MDPTDADTLLASFIPRQAPQGDVAVFREALVSLPASAAGELRKGPVLPDLWRGTVQMLDVHPLPGLLALLLASYRAYGERPDRAAREKLDELVAKHPQLADVMKKHGRRTKIAKLRFKLVPKPGRSSLTGLQKKQLGWFEREGGDYEALELFEVIDEKGTHKYDAAVLAGDDGKVFVAGTTRAVATIAQGGAEAKSEALGAALEQGLADFLKTRAPKPQL